MHDQSIASAFLSVDAAATYAGLSASTFNKLRLTGKGPVYFQPTRRVFYKKDDLDAWMGASRRSSTSELVAA